MEQVHISAVWTYEKHIRNQSQPTAWLRQNVVHCLSPRRVLTTSRSSSKWVAQTSSEASFKVWPKGRKRDVFIFYFLMTSLTWAGPHRQSQLQLKANRKKRRKRLLWFQYPCERKAILFESLVDIFRLSILVCLLLLGATVVCSGMLRVTVSNCCFFLF